MQPSAELTDLLQAEWGRGWLQVSKQLARAGVFGSAEPERSRSGAAYARALNRKNQLALAIDRNAFAIHARY